MAEETKNIAAIKQIIVHPSYYVPMEFHRLTRVEFDISRNRTLVTFASYFNQAAFDNGGTALDYNTFSAQVSEQDFTEVLNALVAEGGELEGGKVV